MGFDSGLKGLSYLCE